MELKEFIKVSITAIVEAIEELNEELPDGAIVSPGSARVLIDGKEDRARFVCQKNGKDNGLINEVEFDLSLSDVASNNLNGKAGINVIGFGMANTTEKEARNNIRFSIPVVYPSPKSE